jgi:hypothetical protein
LIPINAPPAEDCTLEAMRTQACANQCMDFKGFYLHSLRLTDWISKDGYTGIPQLLAQPQVMPVVFQASGDSGKRGGKVRGNYII